MLAFAVRILLCGRGRRSDGDLVPPCDLPFGHWSVSATRHQRARGADADAGQTTEFKKTGRLNETSSLARSMPLRPGVDGRVFATVIFPPPRAQQATRIRLIRQLLAEDYDLHGAARSNT